MMTELLQRCINADYCHTNDGGDYAIQIDGNTIYLLFQWSKGAEDWKNNFDFPAVPYKRMHCVWLCHRGFLRVWKSMRDEIEDKISELITENDYITNIICVGYSHGAALSVFATEDMAYIFGDGRNVSGYGFGCPRALWGILPKTIKERLKGFVAVRNIPDIVTHVPPAILGYRHAGKLLKIGKKKKYTPVKAHYPAAYTAELKNNYSEV